MSHFLSGKRIILSTLKRKHLPCFLKLWNNGSVMKFLGFPKGLNINEEEVRKHIQAEPKNYKLVPARSPLHLAVELKAGPFLGEAVIGRVRKDGISEPDVKLLPKFQGAGYAKEALELIIDFTFKNSDCKAIQVTPNVENRRALNLYKRLGFKMVKDRQVYPNTSSVPGVVNVEYYTYHLTRFDWEWRKRSGYDVSNRSVIDLLLLEPYQLKLLIEATPYETTIISKAYPKIREHLKRTIPKEFKQINKETGKLQNVPKWEVKSVVNRMLQMWWFEITYVKEPERYDAMKFHKWNKEEVTSLLPQDCEAVIDCGAGTGSLTFALSTRANRVYALEPVRRLRQFIREKAEKAGIHNIISIDGTNANIPLANNSVDGTLSSFAFGWSPDEISELERITRKGGIIVILGGDFDSIKSGNFHRKKIHIPTYKEPLDIFYKRVRK